MLKRRARFHRNNLLAAISLGLLVVGLASSGRAQTAAATDAALQRAATEALGRRAGAVIVLDAQTGRVRAVVNPRVAFEQAHPPGSTLKPFVTVAALRSGALKSNMRLHCGTVYERGSYHATCVHPADLPPLDVRRALAYSCNYFFGKLGEQLDGARVRTGLSAFGLGGALPRNDWQSRYAIGDSQRIRVTPAQLIAAYAALANGGKLYALQRGEAENFTPRLRGSATLTAEQRRLVLEGLRGSVSYGTARASGLKSLPINVFGKTGTMIDDDGENMQGWFVGLASESSGLPAPAQVKLAVLVYLSNAKGADCAELSEPIFAAWSKALAQRNRAPARRAALRTEPLPQRHNRSQAAGVPESVPDETEYAHAAVSRRSSPSVVRVRRAGESAARVMPLEEYVLGVVATEGSLEDQPEALKALAVAARTYARKNLHRHGREGYDFCTLTHCQRFSVVTGMRQIIRQAVRATAGQVLTARGDLIESYYSASCGGMTADVQTLWQVPAQSYLRGLRDEACAEGPHAQWRDVIAADKLAAALRRDPRTDVGGRLDDIRVTPDATGRAQSVTLTGERTRTVGGWDFKLIVGRSLGWNYLKSSLFTVKREGAEFVFDGRGFGHGLGLCQEGAHMRAVRGASYRRILAQYFPGTTLRRDL